MGFLSGTSSNIGNFFHGLADFLDGNNDDKKKQQQQQQKQTVVQKAAPQPKQDLQVAQPSQDLSNVQRQDLLQKMTPKLPAIPAPEPAPVAPVLAPPPPAANTLVKAKTSVMSPAQLRAQATLKSLGGPVNPNAVSRNPSLGDNVNAAAAGIGNLGSNINDNINHSPLLMKVINSVGGSLVADPNSPLSAPAKAKSLTQTAGNVIGNIDPQIGELMNPGSYAKGGAELVAAATKGVKAIPGLLSRGAETLNGVKNAVGDIRGSVGNLLNKVTPTEAPKGVTSINPTKAADAVASHVDSLPDEALAHPDVVNAANGIAPPAPVTSGAMHATESEALDNLTKMSKTQILTPEEAAVRDTLQAKQDAITSVNAPAELDVPTAQRKGVPAPTPESNLDIPTFQRNDADALVKAAQDKADAYNGLVKAAPTDAVSKAAAKQELAAAMAKSPEEGAAVLKKQLLQKTVDPEAEAHIAGLKEKANAELSNAKLIKQAHEQLNPTSEPKTPALSKAVTAETPSKSVPVSSSERSAPVKAEPAVAPSVSKESLVKSTTVPEKPAKVASEAPAKVAANPVEAKMAGTAKTGETGKSRGKFAKGSEYEKTSQEAANARGANEAANTSYDKLKQKISDNGGMTTADRDTAKGLLGRFSRTSDEYKDLSKIVGGYHTEAAQVMSTIERDARATADPKALTDRFAQKLYSAADDVKVGDSDFKGLEQKNQAFTDARDAHNQALEDFHNDTSQANADNFFKKAQEREAADSAAKMEEYKLASRLTKGNKDPKVEAFVKKLEQDSGVYTMDATDASALSGTRTIENNYLNTAGVLAEELLWGKLGAAAARILTGVNIGGGNLEGVKMGARLGLQRLINDMRLRQQGNGNWVSKTLKNIVTTANTLGEHNIYSSAYSGIYDYYRNQLKVAGYKGAELERRAQVQAYIDADKQTAKYMGKALEDNAMAPTVGGRSEIKVETWLADKISKTLGDSGLAKWFGKTTMRATIGFPTVVGRSLVGGTKRATLGSLTGVRAGWGALHGADPEVTAGLIKSAVKEAGSGAAMYGIGTALGAAGLISGSYPPATDKDGRAQWDREKKSENSIKILGSWYSLSSPLGVLALPLIVAGNGGRNLSEGKGWWDDAGTAAAGAFIDSMPTDSLTNSLAFVKDIKDGNSKAVDKFLAATAASGVRMATPLGSFVAEVARMFDSTANDTTIGDGMAQFLAKISNGNPLTVNSVENRVIDGDTVANPNPLEIFAGAQTTERSAGVAKTADIKGKMDAGAQALSDNGALTDNVRNILDDATKGIFDKAKAGKTVQPSDMDKLLKGMTKNVDATKPSRFLSDGDYESNLAVLKAKQQLLKADPTTTQDELDNYDMQVKRGQVAKDGKVAYGTIKGYGKTSLSEWRDMGDPKSDAYDQATYDKLYAYDVALSKAGVSGNNTSPDITKYSPKAPPKGHSGSGSASAKSNTLNSTPSFSTVNLSGLAPEKISAAAAIPTIQQIKPGDLIKKRAISVSKV